MDTSKLFMVVGLVSLVAAGFLVFTNMDSSSNSQVVERTVVQYPGNFQPVRTDAVTAHAVVMFNQGGNQK